MVQDPGFGYRQIRVQILALGFTNLSGTAHVNEHIGTMVSVTTMAYAFVGLTVKGVSQIVEPSNV